MVLGNTLALCGLLWAVPIQGQLPRNFQESVEYVQGLQTPTGGFVAARPEPGQKPGRPSLRATLAALRAIKYFGGQVKDEKPIREFVTRCHDAKTGGFADSPAGKADVFATAIGLMAIAELKMPVERYRAGAVKFLEENAKNFEDIRIAAAGLESVNARAATTDVWIRQIRKLQNPDGTFGTGDGKARLTGAAVVTILRLGGTVDHRENVLEALKEGQRLNGGFGAGKMPNDADLATGYQVMRAFHMLKAVPNSVEGLRTFVEKCRNEDGGYSNTPGTESSVGATYYASIIHSWLKGLQARGPARDGPEAADGASRPVGGA